MNLALEELAAGAGGKLVSQLAKRRLAWGEAAKRPRSEAQPS